MQILCLDIEGVLFPELWVLLAKRSGIAELSITTREQPNFSLLMSHRLELLKRYRLTIEDARAWLADTDPLAGAQDFLARQRKIRQVVLVSDSFYELLTPLMPKLNYPTLLCHHLSYDQNGIISGWRERTPNHKQQAAQAMQYLGFEVFAAGDSYNDVPMLQNAHHSWFVNAPQHITHEFPHIATATDLSELEKLMAPFARDTL